MAPPGFHLHFLDNLLCFQNKSASTFQAAQRHSCLGRPDLAMSQQDVPVEVFAAHVQQGWAAALCFSRGCLQQKHQSWGCMQAGGQRAAE